MIRRFALLSCLMALSACASATKGSSQEVTLYTTGADSAICYIEQGGFRQRIWVPQRVHVMRSSADMFVTCVGPGNREKVVVVGSRVNNSPAINAWNGVLPGMAVDYASGAMFSYPDTVEIDFSDMPPTTYDLPAYERQLREHPESAGTAMEEFRPGRPALISDMYESIPTLRLKTDEDIAAQSDVDLSGASVSAEGEKTGGDASSSENSSPSLSGEKISSGGGASPAADSLTRSMNPQVFSTKK